MSEHEEHVDAPSEWPDDAIRDRFVGDWWLYQRRNGHRTSSDDQLTAWSAVSSWDGPPPARYLDLGCGVGSVLLVVAHALRPALSLGVEAQPQSVLLAQRSIDELPSPPPIAVRCADFRALETGAYDLITGSPPYFPLGTGTVSADPQKRACRFEIRGGVEAYCAAAARLLAQGGHFHLVFQTTWDARVLQAASDVGLVLHGRLDVRMKTSSAEPFLTVYHFRAEAALRVSREVLAIRTADGQRTSQYDAIRAHMGLERPA